MKRYRIYIIIGILLLVVVGIYFGLPFWRSIRGVIAPPPKDITKELQDNLGLTLPPGFSIGVFAKDLKAPRVMMYDSVGNILTSIPSEGKVVALPDRNGDGVADEVITVIENLNRPHGLAMRCDDSCDLYIAESDQVAAYDYDEKNIKALNKKKVASLPDGGRHFTRTIIFRPYPNEDELLISVGSSCDVCHEEDARRAKVLSLNTKDGSLETFASGLRNSVFLAIHPVSGKIWGTEMGRDWLGDEFPPDEINIIERDKNYGWPICYGKNIHDGEFDKNTYIRNPCMEPFETGSYIDLPAHSAPLGLAFFGEEGWPEEYWYNMLVAYHGSWNRSEPTGYKLVRYELDARGKIKSGTSEKDFISGWLDEDGALGRPVDILIQPGGRIFISDDKAGVIYLVKFHGK